MQPSDSRRYATKLERVLGVLESALKERDWLVGDKMTFADLAFVAWNERINALDGPGKGERLEGFPNVKAWHERMTRRPTWGKVLGKRERLMDEQGLQANGIPGAEESLQEYERLILGHTQRRAGGRT
jgi:glutathione S-transferase